ncbi:MAG: NADH-ubiquinone oxidoreductase-F iron-sulfur binding region domain-containing protein, partial [Candidatus Dormibacteraceae bacterium]
IRNPGVYEIELGMPFRQLIMDIAGGPLPGRELKAFWPGGSSSPVLPASMLDVGTDMEALAAAGSMAGSGGVIVMDNSWCMVKAAARLLRFYAFESCGKCTPCREGGNWAVRSYQRLLQGKGSNMDLQILDRIQDGLQNGRCLCGLGDSAGWVIMSSMRYFRHEYEAHANRSCQLCPQPEPSTPLREVAVHA